MPHSKGANFQYKTATVQIQPDSTTHTVRLRFGNVLLMQYIATLTFDYYIEALYALVELPFFFTKTSYASVLARSGTSTETSTEYYYGTS